MYSCKSYKVKKQLETLPIATGFKNGFFHISTRSTTTKNFLDALTRNSFQEATAYLSKTIKYPQDLLGELTQSLSNSSENNWEYKCLIKMSNIDRNVKSVLVIHERKCNNVLHLHLIHEPDKYSTWKIHEIEQE